MKTNLTQVTNIKSWSLGLEMENNLPTDRIRIKFRLGWGLKCGIRSRQGFRLRFKEWMLSVEVVRSVVRQMWVFACVCFMEEEETAYQKSRKAALFVYRDPVWDLGLTTFESDNFQTSLWMQRTERLRDSCKHFYLQGTHQKNTLFFSASHTHTHEEWVKKAADVACAWHSLSTVIPCATTAVNCQKSALIVCARLSEKPHISPSFKKTRLKLAWPFKNLVFPGTKIEIKWLAGKQKPPPSFWASHSLRLGAQALHKMSIDKFSSAYVTHAQFESYWWGRKETFISFQLLSANEFFCGKAANMQQQWQQRSTRSRHGESLSWRTPRCEGNVIEMFVRTYHPSTSASNVQPPHEYPHP